MSSTTPPVADDATLIAAQQAFVTSGSKPAAKVLRAVSPKRTKAPPPNTQAPSTTEWSKAPDWYQQMKGVRFRLDDLEDEEGDLESFSDRMASRRKDKPVVEGQGAVMGEIVERTTTTGTVAPVFISRGSQKASGGFPAPRKFAGRQNKGFGAQQNVAVAQEKGQGEALEGKELMEEIDRENRKKMAEMSEEEILETQRSLQASFSPEFLEMLLRKETTSQEKQPATTTTSKQPALQKSESIITPSQPPKSSAAAAASTQSKPSTINDPSSMDDKSFDQHLRTFFPATLTTSVPPPEWTLPVHPAEETFYSQPNALTPEASTMRFDFHGKYIPATTSRSLPTHLGLHHHSLDPGAAGYTLAELAILARSVQPSQKCIALKILGGVLAEVARGTVYPWDVQEGLWDEIERERCIEIMLEVAKGGRQAGGNMSVQRYAEDAVMGWVNAGGPKQWEERLKRKGFERVPDTE